MDGSFPAVPGSGLPTNAPSVGVAARGCEGSQGGMTVLQEKRRKDRLP